MSSKRYSSPENILTLTAVVKSLTTSYGSNSLIGSLDTDKSKSKSEKETSEHSKNSDNDQDKSEGSVKDTAQSKELSQQHISTTPDRKSVV